MDALGGWRGQIVIFNVVFCSSPRGAQGGPYLLGELPEVIYPWDSHQLLPPIRCVGSSSLPLNPIFIVFQPGVLKKDHSLCPPLAWWLAPAGSIQGLAPAPVEGPDQDHWRPAQVLVLLERLFLGLGK